MEWFDSLKIKKIALCVHLHFYVLLMKKELQRDK